MKKISILLSLIISVFICSPVFADSVDVSSADKWTLVDSHKIIIYKGGRAIALLDLPYCFIYSTSDIKFINDYVSNWDKILIDGEVCDIRSVKRL